MSIRHYVLEAEKCRGLNGFFLANCECVSDYCWLAEILANCNVRLVFDALDKCFRSDNLQVCESIIGNDNLGSHHICWIKRGVQ